MIELTPETTIAEVIAAGNTHIRVRCPACERSVLNPVPWRTWRNEWTVAHLAARLYCDRCGARPPELEAYNHSDHVPKMSVSMWGTMAKSEE